MTLLSAQNFGPHVRGTLRPGSWADLMLFRPDEAIDRATLDEPKVEPVGIKMVVVNGAAAYRSGEHTRASTGHMLRYRRDSCRN